MALPDEVFFLYIEKAWGLLSKQIGMATYGYDFQTEEQKAVSKFLSEGVIDTISGNTSFEESALSEVK